MAVMMVDEGIGPLERNSGGKEIGQEYEAVKRNETRYLTNQVWDPPRSRLLQTFTQIQKFNASGAVTVSEFFH